MEYQLKQHVFDEGIKKQKAMDMHESMHRKCVKYHDLVHGLLTTMSDMLSEMKCVTPAEADELLEAMAVDDFKLSVDVEQIEQAIEGFAALRLPKKILEYRQKMKTSHSLIHRIASLTNDIKKMK